LLPELLEGFEVLFGELYEPGLVRFGGLERVCFGVFFSAEGEIEGDIDGVVPIEEEIEGVEDWLGLCEGEGL